MQNCLRRGRLIDVRLATKCLHRQSKTVGPYYDRRCCNANLASIFVTGPNWCYYPAFCYATKPRRLLRLVCKVLNVGKDHSRAARGRKPTSIASIILSWRHPPLKRIQQCFQEVPLGLALTWSRYEGLTGAANAYISRKQHARRPDPQNYSSLSHHKHSLARPDPSTRPQSSAWLSLNNESSWRCQH